MNDRHGNVSLIYWKTFVAVVQSSYQPSLLYSYCDDDDGDDDEVVMNYFLGAAEIDWMSVSTMYFRLMEHVLRNNDNLHYDYVKEGHCLLQIHH